MSEGCLNSLRYNYYSLSIFCVKCFAFSPLHRAMPNRTCKMWNIFEKICVETDGGVWRGGRGGYRHNIPLWTYCSQQFWHGSEIILVEICEYEVNIKRVRKGLQVFTDELVRHLRQLPQHCWGQNVVNSSAYSFTLYSTVLLLFKAKALSFALYGLKNFHHLWLL